MPLIYAQIVAEKAILRRLVEAGTRIVQLGYGGSEGSVGGGEVDEIVDRAQAEIYDVTERRTSEDYVVLEELLQPTMDEIDAIAQQGGRAAGVPTGFADLDNLTNGLHPGQMIIVAARPGIGKALALDTPLITPTGWTTMEAVSVGDELIGADGRPTRVIAVTDVLLDRPCFQVEFSDGQVIVADAEHQWLTWDAAARRVLDGASSGARGWPAGGRWTGAESVPRCRTTAELAAGLYDGAELNHSVPTCSPIQTEQVDLPTEPLGSRLPPGRGRSRRHRSGGLRAARPGMGDEGVRPARLPGRRRFGARGVRRTRCAGELAASWACTAVGRCPRPTAAAPSSSAPHSCRD